MAPSGGVGQSNHENHSSSARSLSRSRSTNGAANLARKKIVKAAKSELSPLVQDMSLFCSAKEAS